MLENLTSHELTLSIDPKRLGFSETSQLTGKMQSAPWIGQEAAYQAAQFGLNMHRQGFHLAVVAEAGCGHVELMLSAMQGAASKLKLTPDLIYLNHFELPEKPLLLRVKAGTARALRHGFESMVRHMAKTMAYVCQDANLADQVRMTASKELTEQLALLSKCFVADVENTKNFESYLTALKQDFLDNLELFQNNSNNDNDGLIESFLGRYRVNVLVDQFQLKTAPVIYDDDPSFQSLFGGIESSSDSSNNLPDFMRLRAGNLLRANGGFLMVHLRDIQADQQNGSQILEKLHRFLRNGHVQIEDASSASSQSVAMHYAAEALAVNVKLVLITSPEEYYQLQEEEPELARYFNVKVDFVEQVLATDKIYQDIALFVAHYCEEHQIKHLSAAAMASLLLTLHREIESQTRIGTQLDNLKKLLLESASQAEQRSASLIEAQDIEAALAAKYARLSAPERQLCESIIDGELMIAVQGRAVGQINGLTHVDLGDSSFGSPIRISARCYVGEAGVINIDREIDMTGATHDKGLLILKHWLSASFASLTPLSLNASLVFEQEYHGVDGDSATCAELYALLSAITGLALPQGMAVTGAMNQHGEVMAVGGLNEKIEGYFKLCQAIGLNGSQGVLIPSRNLSHLILNAEVIQAVEKEQFHIYTMDHVLEGVEHLTGLHAGAPDEHGHYSSDTLMGRVQRSLEDMRKTMAENKFSRHI